MARPGTHVQLAEPADIDELVELCLEARAESAVGSQLCTPDPAVLANQLRTFSGSGEGRIIVARHEGAMAGLVLARLIGPGPFTDETSVHVEALFVGSDHRRRGVGHALLAELLSLADVVGARYVYAVPLPGARGMQRFLARLGFAPAAAHRVATVAALQRRLASGSRGPRVGRPRGLENLIARRRQASGARNSSAGPDEDEHGPAEPLKADSPAGL